MLEFIYRITQKSQNAKSEKKLDCGRQSNSEKKLSTSNQMHQHVVELGEIEASIVVFVE